jgi:hypothetical protein
MQSVSQRRGINATKTNQKGKKKIGLSIKYSTTLINLIIGERKTGVSRSFSFLADKEGRRRNFGAKD